jgi:hypothetical protein
VHSDSSVSARKDAKNLTTDFTDGTDSKILFSPICAIREIRGSISFFQTSLLRPIARLHIAVYNLEGDNSLQETDP